MRLPPPLSWFYDAWMEFSRALGRVMSFIILTILWIVGLGIYNLIGRIASLFGKKTEDRGWLDIPPPAQDDLRRQF